MSADGGISIGSKDQIMALIRHKLHEIDGVPGGIENVVEELLDNLQKHSKNIAEIVIESIRFECENKDKTIEDICISIECINSILSQYGDVEIICRKIAESLDGESDGEDSDDEDYDSDALGEATE